MVTRYTLLIGILLSFFTIVSTHMFVFADDTASSSASTNSQSKDELRNKIRDLEGKVSDLRGQEKTLSTQISVMTNQVKLTEYRIEATKEQIQELQDNIKITTEKIAKLQASVNDVSKVLVKRIQASYEVGTVSPIAMLLSSSDISNYITRHNYLNKMQQHDRELIYAAQQAKIDYANEKQIFSDKEKKVQALKAQLENYTKELEAEQENKKTLLAQTQGSEANYQRLLSQAKAQLAGFSSFVANQGGASLLSNQTTCDDWGCYYNQRDSQWGGSSLNGTEYTIASDGCLVTSMAMVMTHYGHKTLPSDINANSSNFASYYPAYLLYTTSANGVTAQRVGATIDDTLRDGNPVIVGIRAYGGTHFVVLRSGSGGNYMMNDPFVENGNNIPFGDHYSVGSIFEIDKVVIQ